MKRVLLVVCFAVLMASFGCQNQDTASTPVIGITSVYKLNEDTGSEQTFVNFAYVRAVAENGGAMTVSILCISPKALAQAVAEWRRIVGK